MTEVAALEIVRDHSLYYKVRWWWWRWCSWWIWGTWNDICQDDFYDSLIQLQTRNLNEPSLGARWRSCANFGFDADYDGSLFQGETKMRFIGALWLLCAKAWSSPAIQLTRIFVHWDSPAVSFIAMIFIIVILSPRFYMIRDPAQIMYSRMGVGVWVGVVASPNEYCSE